MVRCLGAWFAGKIDVAAPRVGTVGAAGNVLTTNIPAASSTPRIPLEVSNIQAGREELDVDAQLRPNSRRSL